MKNRLALLCSLACFQMAFSQSATVDKQQVLLGEPFTLQLKGVLAGNTNWPRIDSLSHFEILERSKIDTQRSISGVELTQSFTLTSFDSGRWQIPALQLGAARSAPISVEVVFTSPFDPNQPYHDVKEIIEIKKPVESKWYWYLVFALLLIGLFLLFFPRGKKKDKDVFVPDEGAYKTALRKLGQLRRKEGGDAKEFYTELVDIFRTYLHKRKNIQSFSKTTDDLSIRIGRLQMPADQYHGLVQTLRLSDMAKFARFQPSPEENGLSVDTIEQNIMTIERIPDAV